MKTILRISNLPTKKFNAGKHVESILKIKNYKQINVSDKKLGAVNYRNKRFQNYELNLNKNILINYIKLYKLIKQNNINIISIHQYKYFFLPFFFKNLKKTYHFHGKDKILLKFYLFRSLLKKYDKVFSVSPLKYDNYIKIENFIPIDLIEFQNKNKVLKKMNQICFVGRIDKNKNLELLLKSQKYYNSNISLKIVGDGPLYKELKLKYKNDQIQFLGRLNYHETLKIISESKTLVLTSFSEGHPKVYIEAKFLKCNFISYKHEFINPYLKSNYLITDLKDPKKLAQLIDLSINETHVEADNLMTEIETINCYQKEYDEL